MLCTFIIKWIQKEMTKGNRNQLCMCHLIVPVKSGMAEKWKNTIEKIDDVDKIILVWYI